MIYNKTDSRNISKLFSLSKYKIITGVLIGLLYSIIFYFLLYVLREGFRFLSINERYKFLTLNETELNFYNTVFTFISFIIGQSICFNFWLNKPKVFFKTKSTFDNTILVDFTALNWNFIYWFAKVSLIYGTIVELSIKSEYNTISLYPDSIIFSILLILTLFLQQWVSILLKYKRKAYKWMLISAIIISVFSFSISRINLIDYKALNAIAESKCTLCKYQLDLPTSEYYTIYRKRAYEKDIYLVQSKQLYEKPIVIIENKEIEIDSLPITLSKWREEVYEFDRIMISHTLNIHQKIKMKYVIQLLEKIAEASIFYSYFAVNPIDSSNNKISKKDCSFRYKWILRKFKKEYKIKINNNINVFTLKQTIPGEYITNDGIVKSLNLKHYFRKKISENPKYLVKFYINENLDFSEYFNVISSLRTAINDLRNEYSLKQFGKNFEFLNERETDIIYELYPFNFNELTEKEAIEEKSIK